MKLFYVAVMALSLSGCASTNTKEQYPDSCEHFSKTNAWGQNTREDIEYIKVETSEKSEFYEPTPSKVFSSIESAQLSGSILTLTIVDNGLFEQYSVPVVDTIRQVQYEAHRFTGTFTPVGIFVWLLNPKLMNDYTFGCTARHLLSTEPDTTRKVKTGKSEWKVIQKSHRILVSGFDKDYEFDIDAYTSPKVIDLSTAILNTELTENTTLKVTCLNCDLLGSEEQNLYKDSKTNIVLTHDFRPIKESMAESRHAQEASNTQQLSTEQAKAVEQSTQATPSPIAQPSEQPIPSKSASDEYNEVKMTKSGGVYSIPVLINDVLRIKFVLDSGAADVSISQDVFFTLIKTETIKKRDWLPGEQYRLADGSIAQSDRFNIRTLKIGNRILKNVACSISNSTDAPMLLGQSALEQLGSYTFDYEAGTVRFNK